MWHQGQLQINQTMVHQGWESFRTAIKTQAPSLWRSHFP
jgi:hypothetical protein